jgi:hypothetical protein
MNQLLEKAFDAVRRLTAEEQDEIAGIILTLAGDKETLEESDPAHLPSIHRGLEQAQRREFASEAEIDAAFGRFGL